LTSSEGESRRSLATRARATLTEFRDFFLRGNLVELAVAVVMGTAFGALVTAFTQGLVTPLIAAIGGQPDFLGPLVHRQRQPLPLRSVPQRAGLVPDHRGRRLLPRSQAAQHDDGAPQGCTAAGEETRPCPECISEIPVRARRCAFCTAEVGAGGEAGG
jgi:large conductance mechanosensitive channel